MYKVVLIAVLSLVFNFNLFAEGIVSKNEYRAIIKTFVDAVKSDNHDKIADLINYPLRRPYPISSIDDKKEFLSRFNQVFDKELIQKIINSSIEKDWRTLGWRGIVLENGLIYLDYDGKVFAINNLSKIEEQIQVELLKQDKMRLHKSLRKFVSPCLVGETEKYKIRIDDLGKENYRYAAWEVGKSQLSKPDLIIENGKVVYDGSGGNHYYEFKNGKYRYRILINEIGTAETPAGELEVYQGTNKIIHQNIIKLN